MKAYKTIWPKDGAWEGAVLVKDASTDQYLVLMPTSDGFYVLKDEVHEELDYGMSNRPDFIAVEVPDRLPDLIHAYVEACESDSKSGESSAFQAINDALGPELAVHIRIGALVCPA
jgi:hypothetical protein